MQTRIARNLSLLKQYIKAALPQTKKHWIVSVSFAIVLFGLCLFITNTVHAEEAAAAAAPASEPGTMANIGTYILTMITKAILMIAQICIKMTIFALEFFVKLAKYNGYVDAPIVILGWTMIRDIANMFFVVVLLVIAFGTILGLEQYEWKKTMVNFILAAIFINFSKLIAGLIIDVAHVFTMTFTNAIAATAGGNIINMFHLSDIVSIVSGGFQTGDPTPDIVLEVFGGAVMALVFAVLAMVTMGAYLIVMVARIVVLWALIILSPLAYILNVIPQTKSYADTWWSEFGKHVMVAPIMVFFLWLGFATLGSGSFVQNDLGIAFGSDATATDKALGLPAASIERPKVSVSNVSTWENMANFILAIAFLWVGIEQVQKTGVRGGEMLSHAKSFATKAALIGSGYALGRWLTGEAGDLGGKGLKQVGYRIPLVGGRAWQTRGYNALEKYGRAQEWIDNKAKGLDSGYRDLQKGKLTAKYEGGSTAQYSSFNPANIRAVAGRFAASVIETGGRKDKIRDDYKEAYERRMTVVEESYSTSGLPGGSLKQEVTGQLKFVEALGKAKSEAKVKDIMGLILANNDSFKAYAKPAMVAEEKARVSDPKEKIERGKRLGSMRSFGDGLKTDEKAAKLEIESQKREEIIKEKQNILMGKTDGKFTNTNPLAGVLADTKAAAQLQQAIAKGFEEIHLDEALGSLFQDISNNSLAQVYLAMQQQKVEAVSKKERYEKEREKTVKGKEPGISRAEEIAKHKAITENLQKTISRASDIQLATARAVQYKQNGQFLKADQTLQSVYQRHEEEDSKEISGLNRQQRKDVASQLLTSLGSTTDPEEKAQITRDLTRLVTVSANKGADDFKSLMESALPEIYNGDTVDLKEEDASKHFLEMVTGKKISSEAEYNDAFKAFNVSFEAGKPRDAATGLITPQGEKAAKSEQQAVLASLSNAFWAQGESGGLNFSAAVGSNIESDPDKPILKRKVFEIRPSYSISRDENEDRKGNIDALSNEYLVTRDVMSIIDMVNSQMKADPSGKVDKKGKRVYQDRKVTEVTSDQMSRLKSWLTSFSDTREVAQINRAFSVSTQDKNFEDGAKKQMAKLFKELQDDLKGKGLSSVYAKIMQTQFSDLYNDAIVQAEMGSDWKKLEDLK